MPWNESTERYAPRIAGLLVHSIELLPRFNAFNALSAPLPHVPSEVGLLKYLHCQLVMQAQRSRGDLVRSIQLLWPEGRFIASFACIRLLMEVWGMLVFAESKVLPKLDE